MAGYAAMQAQAVVATVVVPESSIAAFTALCYTVNIPSSGTFAGEALFNTDLFRDDFSENADLTVLGEWDETPSPSDIGGELTPEPASAGLILLGAAGMLLRRKVK